MSTLPEVDIDFIETEPFFTMLQELDSRQCRDENGEFLLTILDFRNANHFGEAPPPSISTSCPVKKHLLDDIQSPEVRNELPSNSRMITITETGNRDEFVVRYLSQYGYTDVKALKFGMRGWLKLRYPTQ